ncbi:MAG: hypothetical protein H0V93_15710 [Euzebyales bacterium]|nr:hypothetical protein [Euzebyales bacterium]
MRARYVIRIGPSDVGARVSVRARIEAAPGEPAATDVVGVLLSWAGGVLVVQRRDGTRATIAAADLLAGRRIPPEPVRRPRS